MKVFTKISLSIALISIGLGIGLLMIARGNNSSLQYTPRASMEDTVGDVRRLDIRIDFGEVIITQGDEFSIEAKNLYRREELKSQVSDDVWYINHDTSESFSVFGFDIPISYGFRNLKMPIIKITLPKDFKAEDIRIHLDVGRLKAENLHSDRGIFTVDAGTLEIDGLVIENESEYFAGAGEINLKNVDIRDIKVECDVGAVYIDGLISGDNEILCDVGAIKVNLDADIDLFSFDIDSDIGNVIINNKKYWKYRSTNDNNMYKGSFRLDVEVGNITMDFNE